MTRCRIYPSEELEAAPRSSPEGDK